MAKYRVTLRVSSVEIVEADNPYQAAVIASGRHGDEDSPHHAHDDPCGGVRGARCGVRGGGGL